MICLICIKTCYVFILFWMISGRCKSLLITSNAFKLYLDQVPDILINLNQIRISSRFLWSWECGIWQFDNVKFDKFKFEIWIWNLKFEFWSLRVGIWNLKFEDWILNFERLQFEVWTLNLTLNLEIWILGNVGTWNSKSLYWGSYWRFTFSSEDYIWGLMCASIVWLGKCCGWL